MGKICCLTEKNAKNLTVPILLYVSLLWLAILRPSIFLESQSFTVPSELPLIKYRPDGWTANLKKKPKSFKFFKNSSFIVISYRFTDCLCSCKWAINSPAGRQVGGGVKYLLPPTSGICSTKANLAARRHSSRFHSTNDVKSFRQRAILKRNIESKSIPFKKVLWSKKLT